MIKKKVVTILTCAAAAVCLTGCAGTSKETESKAEKTESTTGAKTQSTAAGQGKALPLPVYFEGTDMEGSEISAEIFEDSKVTMINVWATYCNPCLNEMPELGELAGEYDPGDFQIIGVISDVQEGADQETLEYAQGLIEETKAAYPHLLLNESIYNALLKEVTAVPTTMFCDKNGVILDTVIGARDKEQWEEIINGLLENL